MLIRHVRKVLTKLLNFGNNGKELTFCLGLKMLQESLDSQIFTRSRVNTDHINYQIFVRLKHALARLKSGVLVVLTRKEIIIQTYNPSHYAIQVLPTTGSTYEAFYAYEMGIRRQLAYPPYFYTVGMHFLTG